MRSLNLYVYYLMISFFFIAIVFNYLIARADPPISLNSVKKSCLINRMLALIVAGRSSNHFWASPFNNPKNTLGWVMSVSSLVTVMAYHTFH